jgi:hypothetical protein
MKTALISLFMILLATSAFAYQVNVPEAGLTFTNVNLAGFMGDTLLNLNKGYALPVNPGEPSLPSMAVSLALPTGMEIESVTIEHAEPVILPGYHHLFPAQMPTPIGSEPSKYVAANPTIYSSASPFPGKIAYSFASGNMGGYSIGTIVMAPIQYIPASGQLIFYRNIEFTVNLKPATMGYVYPNLRYDWADTELRNGISAMVINPEEIAAPPVMTVEAGMPALDNMYSYLIIAADSLEAASNNLADWKTRKGRRAKVISLSSVTAAYTGADTQEKVRNCIKDYYTNHGTQFVCLIGTGALLPMRNCYDPSFDTLEGNHMVPTDNYYGCLDGDWNADLDTYWGESTDGVDYLYDVYVGRIQVDNPTWLATVINKTECYEGSGLSSETNPYDYLNKTLLAGGWLDSSTNEMVLMQTIESSYLNTPFYNFTELWDATYPGGSVFNATNFINQMNAGPGIIAHASHSNSTILGTNSGNVSSAQLLALTNQPKYAGMFYTLGCYDANIDVASNCAAYFVDSSTGGGVNFTGNTRYGWYSPGSPDSGYSSDFEKSYFEYFGTLTEYISGRTLAYHKVPFQGYMGNPTYRFIDYELYLTGDPDIWVPYNSIGTMDITYSPTFGGQTTYTVSVKDAASNPLENALVSLYKPGDAFASGFTALNGNVTLNISPAETGTMYLTVSRVNYRTFEAQVTVNDTGVELVSFAGHRTTRGAELHWQVADPADISCFNLYRRPTADATASVAGEAKSTASAASVSGNGTASLTGSRNDGWTKVNSNPIIGRNPYSYIDSTVGKGEFEYMLEAVVNTKSHGLGTTLLPAGIPVSFGLAVSPNPATSVANITVNLSAASQTKVLLYDLSGRIVRSIINAPLPAGSNAISCDVSSLAKGMYIVQLSSGGNTATRRIVVSH